MRHLDRKELSECNGQDGRAAYVAREGKVYDVSESKMWKGGSHMKLHQAGKDLTAHFPHAPHGAEVFERYPQIGVLKLGQAQRELPGALSTLLKRMPSLRRHPHPMTVHFPIVFMFSTTIFNLLFVLTRIEAFEVTAIHCLGAGILFTPIGILSGLYTWWLNYLAKPLKAVTIKMWFSAILFIVELIVFIWRMGAPDILRTFDLPAVVYFLWVLSLFPLVTVIGWFGTTLTFPVEQD
jgi:predicted heme/steroid binding protein/uncharacterized membrane protein